MRNPQGYMIWNDPSLPGGIKEADSAQCAHCNRHFIVPPKAAPSECGGWCRMCYQPVCNRTECNAECIPFEKKLDAYERSVRFAGQAGLVLD